MSLYGALFSGVSGLQAQSSAMGAIADNVTNVNTVGYKGTDVEFQTLITKQVSLTAYAPGGVQSKPRAGIDVQGLMQASTSSTDVGISGQGFFIVNESSSPESGDIYAYTRAGSFKVDKDGFLQNTSGWYLNGWPLMTWDNSTQASTVTIGSDTYMKAYKNDSGDTVYANDNIVDSTNLKPLNLNTIGGTATASTTVAMGLNLPAGDAVGDSHKTDVQIFDSLGNPHNLNHTWVKRASNAWGYEIIPPSGSEQIVIEDQTTLRNNYYSAGRLDFETIPDSGTSMTMTIDDTDYTIQFTTADDSDVLTQTITVSNNGNIADGETFTVTIDGTATTFEFDNNSSVATAGAIGVTIGSDSTTSAANLSAAIQAKLKSSVGTATWCTASGATITVNLTNNNRISFADATGGITIANSTSQNVTVATQPADGEILTMKVAGQIVTYEFDNNAVVTSGNTSVTIGGNAAATGTNLAAAIETSLDTILGAGVQTVDGGAGDITVNSPPGVVSFVDGTSGNITSTTSTLVDSTLGINVQNRSLSQVMDELAERVQALMHYEFGGIPASPPNSWAERIAGENSIFFRQGSSSYAISVDASGATTSGDPATQQSTAYTVEALSGAVAWTGASNYAIEFNGNGTPDKFFGTDEATSSDPRCQYKVSWANGASDMDGSTTPALSVTLGNYNTSEGSITQFSGAYQINFISQNGASFGNYAGVSIGQDGVVTALFDNGVTKPVFMIPIATLVNPNGMESRTGNVWIETDFSGSPTVREAGQGGAGQIASAALESSTVDIGEEFTHMITTQRAYSAATKIITTADQMLEELMRTKQ